jgi:hypothetical protein
MSRYWFTVLPEARTGGTHCCDKPRLPKGSLLAVLKVAFGRKRPGDGLLVGGSFPARDHAGVAG